MEERSRSREPSREGMDAVSRAPRQELSVQEFMLPVMASLGLGQVSADHPRISCGYNLINKYRRVSEKKKETFY